jgi:hypothetical protein
MKAKIRTRLAPDRSSLHPYIATMKGVASYGWGHTRPEARECLAANLQREARVSARDRQYPGGRRKGRKKH